MLQEAELTLAAPQDWSKIILNHDEKDAFAQTGHIVRFADNNGETHTPTRPEQLLVPRRSDDRDNDLWTVFNTVQENVIKGGLRGVSRDEFGRPRGPNPAPSTALIRISGSTRRAGSSVRKSPR